MHIKNHNDLIPLGYCLSLIRRSYLSIKEWGRRNQSDSFLRHTSIISHISSSSTDGSSWERLLRQKKILNQNVYNYVLMVPHLSTYR